MRMIKQRGFTLLPVLVTLAVLAVIGVVIAIVAGGGDGGGQGPNLSHLLHGGSAAGVRVEQGSRCVFRGLGLQPAGQGRASL